MIQRTIIDWLADDISPYMIVSTIPLSYFSSNNYCVYLLFVNILSLLIIGFGKLILTITRHSWHVLVFNFIRRYVTGGWLSLILGISRVRQYWLGKIAVLATSLALASHILLWAYWYINFKDLFTSTIEFIKAIPQYILDSPKLFEAMMKWLKTIFVGYVLDHINKYWHLQVLGTARKDVSFIIIGIAVIMILVAITILIANMEKIKGLYQGFINYQVNIDDDSNDENRRKSLRKNKNNQAVCSLTPI